MKRLDGSTRPLLELEIRALQAGLREPLVKPTDASYDEARRVWNGMIDRKPAIIARCTGTADVQHVVRFAGEHELLVSVRGGGHNIGGLAIADEGLVIDLSRMRGVFVDPNRRVAVARAGNTLGDVDRDTQAHGLATVLGFVSQTGIAGLTLGGGFGYLTRRFGWTTDNLLAAEVVTPDGRVMRATADQNEDLFWCLRGGGGNFGVVTAFEYALHPVGPTILAGLVAWPGDVAPDLLAFLRELTAAAPRELTTALILRNAPPAPWLPSAVHGKPVCVAVFCHTGTLADAEPWARRLRAFAPPVADIVMPRPYAQMQALLDATQPAGRRYYWKSEYLPGIAPGVAALFAEQARGIPSLHTGLVLFHVGGAIADRPPDDSPAGNRDAVFVANVASSWERPEDDVRNVAWTRGAWEALREFSTGGTYVNFLGEDDGPDRVRAAYGAATLERLATTKQRVDPRDLFRCTKRVG